MKSKLKLEKILMVLFLFCTLNAKNLSDFNSQKYIRKSISYVPFLLQKESYNIKEENVSFILDALRNSVEMKRFDYNLLPNEIVNKFKSEMGKTIEKKKSVSKEEVKEKIKKFLVPEIKKLLNIKMEMRAKELVTETEKNKFIVLKAKESGIKAEDLETVLNSAYIYVPFLSNYKTERKKIKEKERRKVSKDTYKEVEVEKEVITVYVDLDVIWYHISFINNEPVISYLNPPKDFWKRFSNYLGKFFIGEEEKGSHSTAELNKKYEWKDKPISPEDYAFRRSASSEAHGQYILTKEYPEFRLHAQLNEVYSDYFSFNLGEIKKDILGDLKLKVYIDYVSFNLGEKEGVKIDDGYYINEFIENKKGKVKSKKVGYVKVRRVGDNQNPFSIDLSKAQIITGTQIAKGMKAIEYPMQNGSFLPVLIKLPYNVESGNIMNASIKESGGNYSGIGFQFEVDIGNTINDPSWSEAWFLLNLSIAPAKFKFESGEEWGTVAKIDLGIRKKYYFRRFAPFAGFGIGGSFLSVNNPTEDNSSFDTRMFQFNVMGGIELFITPKFSIGGALGGIISATGSKWDYNYEKNDEKYTKEGIKGPKANTNGFNNIIYVNFSI
ncbi:MAG: hypothetical protein ISS29_03460 [Candidatus Marinimicrobia bacterium]|nr:hypothetical protein [Candidatus Neomarinimicrobiota bacterium]